MHARPSKNFACSFVAIDITDITESRVFVEGEGRWDKQQAWKIWTSCTLILIDLD